MILITYGTRPEYLKIKPLIKAFYDKGIKHKLLFTGQHKNLIGELSFSQMDYEITIDDNTNIDRLTDLCSQVMSKFSMIIKNRKENKLSNGESFFLGAKVQPYDTITHVLVQGDTTSALAVALCAYYNKIKVIHLEAGLRTYDHSNPFPEEGNRQLISRITDIHFCPTENNLNNLLSEGVGGKKFVVGNTGLDNLRSIKEEIDMEHMISYVNHYRNEILVTLHRRENHELIEEWFKTINNLAVKYSNYTFVLPIHPNPNVQKYRHLLTNVRVVEPMSHKNLIENLLNAELVISDSGGLQEESSFFGKKMIVCRKTTERPEALGKTSFLCPTPNELEELVNLHLNSYIAGSIECPFGDGKAAEKIADILKNEENC